MRVYHLLHYQWGEVKVQSVKKFLLCAWQTGFRNRNPECRTYLDLRSGKACYMWCSVIIFNITDEEVLYGFPDIFSFTKCTESEHSIICITILRQHHYGGGYLCLLTFVWPVVEPGRQHFKGGDRYGSVKPLCQCSQPGCLGNQSWDCSWVIKKQPPTFQVNGCND